MLPQYCYCDSNEKTGLSWYRNCHTGLLMTNKSQEVVEGLAG